ncbi:uncharacterized protein DNG_05696 [Cephalotrichum gorgonifer]|uniref:Uncharacterized protein n=1 Tax=Cephalotrichum gorgonifer TaxID=2041049 RepID=A0AAE8SVP9_9PEZI|nr:uncharacterized protein DNG_05696 [Cephalotrichum gorgonifer]
MEISSALGTPKGSSTHPRPEKFFFGSPARASGCPAARMSTSSSSSTPLSSTTSKIAEGNSSLSSIVPTPDRTSEEGDDSPDYRSTGLVPRTLNDHCRIYLEDQLYVHALELANSLLTSGPALRNGRPNPALVLPPTQIAFINNLIIHPKHTSRPDTAERREIATLALTYLENLMEEVGPVNANLVAAFQFNHNYSPRPRAPRNFSLDDDGFDDDFGDDGSDEENGRIMTRLGSDESIWNCGNDFWSVVGWAFNCSVAHPARWRWWRIWLDFMLRVLEEDWSARVSKDMAADAQRIGGGDFQFDSMRKSLVAMYSTQKSGRTNPAKWIMKALFADGQQSSLSQFGEVFPMETRDPPRGQKRKRERELDLDNFEYADYGDTEDELEDSTGAEDAPASLSTRASRMNTERDPDKFEHYAENEEAIRALVPFRLRTLALLSQLAYSMPLLFIHVESLHEEFALAMKELPLPLFAAMVNPTENPLVAVEYYAVLLKELLRLFLPPRALDPAKVDDAADKSLRLTQGMIEKCYAPHAAETSSVEDNAKLSILVESALMFAFESGQLTGSTALREAVTSGVEARTRKAKVRRRGEGPRDRV